MSTFPAFTVFDLETTGLDPRKGERIIEIAALRIEEKQITEKKFQSLVNPERSISWEAKQIHKISNDDVRLAPTIDIVLPKFLDFACDSILIAHNAQFDMSFLEQEKECCWGYVDLPECFCTMRLSQRVFPREFRHNLDALAVRLGIPLPTERHRAMPDVLVTALALLKLIDTGNIRSIEELRKKSTIALLQA
ncbi:3'-5' exonuclease [Candidatus Peregrinibacteria bacterium]|nr:3'-5' exonuclease [Candidatus Peregrinibacteria bacterium]